MKKLRTLACMLAFASLALFTACNDDDDEDNGRGGGGGGTDTNEAPASLTGKTMNIVIVNGTAPFDNTGTYNIVFNTDTTHTIQDETGSNVDTGTYTYTQGTNDRGAIIFVDGRGTVTSRLFFDTPLSGTIDSSDGTGDESADFTLN